MEQIVQAPTQSGISQREQLGLRDWFRTVLHSCEQLGLRDWFRTVLHSCEGRQHLITMTFAQLGQDRLENRVHPGQRGHAEGPETSLAYPPGKDIERYISRNVLSCAAFHAATRGPSRIIRAP